MITHSAEHLLIPIAKRGALSSHQIVQKERSSGTIIDLDGKKHQWNWYGFIEIDGMLCIKGDPVDIEAVTALDTDEVYEKAALLYHAFLYASSETSHGFFYTRDEASRLTGILVLPQLLREMAEANSDEDGALCPVIQIPPSRLSRTEWKNEYAAFLSACFLYRFLLGVNPFPSTEFSSSYERAELSGPLFPGSIRPELSKEVSRLLDVSLSLPAALKKRGSYELEEVRRTLKEYPARLATIENTENADTNFGTPEVEAARKNENMLEAHAIEEKRSAPLRRRIYLRRHKKKLIIIGSALVVFLFLASFIGNLLFRARPTDGLPPEQVVEYFYQARNNLDHETLDACLEGSTGSYLVDEVTTLFVITRVRLGYEGSDVLIPAERWLSTGAKEPKEGAMIYGVAAVAITPISRDEETAQFQSSYLQVVPSSGEEQGVVSEPYEISKITEELSLEKKSRRWEINKITPIESSPISRQEALDYLSRHQSQGEH